MPDNTSEYVATTSDLLDKIERQKSIAVAAGIAEKFFINNRNIAAKAFHEYNANKHVDINLEQFLYLLAELRENQYTNLQRMENLLRDIPLPESLTEQLFYGITPVTINDRERIGKSSDTKIFVATLNSTATRDVQFCKNAACDLTDDDSWEDLDDGQVYIGIFKGPAETARTKAAKFANTDENNITLYPIPDCTE